MTVEELKRHFFDENKRVCCASGCCPLLDGYCPTYDCGMLDQLKRLSDKQWHNILNECEKENDLSDDSIILKGIRRSRSKRKKEVLG